MIVCAAIVHTPTVTAATVQWTVINTIWDGSFSLLIAGCIFAAGVFGTLALGEMPLFPATGVYSGLRFRFSKRLI